MKSFVFALTVLLANPLAHASLSSEVDYGNESNANEICRSCDMDSLNQELLDLLYQPVDVAGLESSAIAQVNKMYGFSAKCTSFATTSDMGAWGKIILSEMHRNRYSELYRGAPDLTNACPNYARMDDEGREMVWVMIVNAMAHLESSCQMKAPAKGPNGALQGLLQLHNGQEQKYGKYCRKGDAKTAEGTFRCGLSMLEGQLSRDNSLFSRKSYWDVLRPQAKSQKYLRIQKALKNLSICKAGAVTATPANKLKSVPVPTPRPEQAQTIESIINESAPDIAPETQPSLGRQADSLGGRTE